MVIHTMQPLIRQWVMPHLYRSQSHVSINLLTFCVNKKHLTRLTLMLKKKKKCFSCLVSRSMKLWVVIAAQRNYCRPRQSPTTKHYKPTECHLTKHRGELYWSKCDAELHFILISSRLTHYSIQTSQIQERQGTVNRKTRHEEVFDGHVD